MEVYIFNHGQEYPTICEIDDYQGDYLYFAVPHNSGRYSLEFDFTNFEGTPATLYDAENNMNYIAAEGAVEILGTDLHIGVVRGRIDACYDKDNIVNGNFTVTYCE